MQPRLGIPEIVVIALIISSEVLSYSKGRKLFPGFENGELWITTRRAFNVLILK